MPDDDKVQNALHWSRYREPGVYLGLKAMLIIYRFFGRRFFSVLLAPVILYFFVAGREARTASNEFLARVYATPEGREAIGVEPGWRASFRHFYEFGQSILDKISAWVGEIVLDDVVFINEEVFSDLSKKGGGFVLIGSHLGNMEVCRALSRVHRKTKLNVLVHTKHSANFTRLMEEANPDSTVSLLQTTELTPQTAMQLQAGIDQGEVVVILGDRTPESGSTRHSWAPFLGEIAPFPQGPYILASLFKCPVQLIFCVKRAGRYHITVEPFADCIDIPRKEREAELQHYVERFAERLEFHAKRSPYQWFNFFDFWNQANRAAPRDKGI